MILAGDVGATNARLATFEMSDGVPQRRAEHKYPSGKYTTLEHILHEWRRECPEPIERACFGIAGPVRDQRVEATNLPWLIEARSLSTALDGAPTFLINDLEAMAYGVSALRENELVTLHEGAPTRGNACVIAAGTGLGQAGMYWDGRRHRPFATEGGHASFAPVNELQVELLLYLRRQFQHVSWERVVSGQGLVNVYHFIRDTRGGEEPEWLLEEMRTGDPAAAISKAAMAGKSEACEQALDLFVALYAEECGNAALKFMATGGIYLGGGIPPKILPRLTSSLFHGALTAKGRMRDVLEAMPVRVILNEDTGLIGAAVRGALQD